MLPRYMQVTLVGKGACSTYEALFAASYGSYTYALINTGHGATCCPTYCEFAATLSSDWTSARNGGTGDMAPTAVSLLFTCNLLVLPCICSPITASSQRRLASPCSGKLSTSP
jgi:hypothetical protein